MKILVTTITLFLAGMASCNNKQAQETAGADQTAPAVAMNLEQDASARKAAPAAEAQAQDMSVNPVERKVIRSGEIRFETSNTVETLREVQGIVRDLKGYISGENVYNTGDRIEHMVTVRIPSEQFDILLERIGKAAGTVESKNINSTDVTEEFIDVEARIRTKKELETRYKELLNKASKVDEILNIERELGNLRSEIESMEGRLNYLKNQVSYSTLNIVFYQRTHTAFGFGTRFGQALHQGWNNLLGFMIGMIQLWPFLILVPAVWMLWRRLRRKA